MNIYIDWNSFDDFFSAIYLQAVQKAMTDFDLQGHASTLCGDLSGGTKRKVCAAISMLGSPHLILMDEPTR